MEECPLCLDGTQEGDSLFPLDCENCGFNFCRKCIQGFLEASSQDYQEASDGSRQVKVSLMCPQCRSPYVKQTLQDVVLLRQAHFVLVQHSGQGDSEMAATDLRVRQELLQPENYTRLKDAQARYNHKHHTDWDLTKSLPSGLQSASGDSASPKSNTASPTEHSLSYVDVTLLQGLEDAMSLPEQEYVCQRLQSGEAENLAQGAQILHGVLELLQHGLTTQKKEQVSYRQYQKQAEQLQRLKKRFPLPKRMPCFVTLPLLHNILVAPGNIISKTHKNAGKMGLRKGDVITHVQGEPLTVPFGDWLTAQLQLQDQTDFSIVVNADKETAKLLQERAIKMKEFKETAK